MKNQADIENRHVKLHGTTDFTLILRRQVFLRVYSCEPEGSIFDVYESMSIVFHCLRMRYRKELREGAFVVKKCNLTKRRYISNETHIG